MFTLAVTGVSVKRSTIRQGVVTAAIGTSQVAQAEWTAIIILQAPIAPPMKEWVATVYARLVRARKFLTPGDMNYTLNKLIKLDSGHDGPRLILDADMPATLSGRRLLGLLNVVGSIGHSLFGLATDDQVRSLSDELKVAERGVSVLHHNQQKLLSVVNLTRRFMAENRQDIGQLQERAVLLTESLRQTLGKVADLRLLIDQVKVARHFEHWVASLEIVESQYRHEVRQFLRAREALEWGRLSENILSPPQLEAMLLRLSHHGGIKKASWYYQTTPVELMQASAGRLMFRVRLWATLPAVFSMYKFKSFPVIRKGYAVRVLPREIMAVDRRRPRMFAPLDCRGSDQIVCVVRAMENAGCELNILMEHAHKCPMEILRLDEEVRLVPWSTGRWVISSLRAVQVELFCNTDEPVVLTVNGTELWSVGSGCTLKTGRVVTHQMDTFITTGKLEFETLRFPNISYEIPDVIIDSLPSVFKTTHRLAIRPVETVLEPLPKAVVWDHRFNQSVLWGGILLSGVIIFVFWRLCLRKWHRRCQGRKNNSTLNTGIELEITSAPRKSTFATMAETGQKQETL